MLKFFKVILFILIFIGTSLAFISYKLNQEKFIVQYFNSLLKDINSDDFIIEGVSCNNQDDSINIKKINIFQGRNLFKFENTQISLQKTTLFPPKIYLNKLVFDKALISIDNNNLSVENFDKKINYILAQNKLIVTEIIFNTLIIKVLDNDTIRKKTYTNIIIPIKDEAKRQEFLHEMLQKIKNAVI